MYLNLKNKRPLINGLFIFVFATLILACGSNTKHKTIKLAHGLNELHPVHKGILEMARLVDEISAGQLKVDVYANGQLGQERDLLELLQIGSLDMTKVSAASMENFVPEFKVLTLPYIFVDSAHTWTVLQGPLGKTLLQKGEKYWLRGLCFYDAGSRSFYSKEAPINSPEDLNGLKVRVMNSQSAFSMVNALGGSPTPISYGELYTALQQGIVDAAENNAPSFYTSKHYEICKHFSIDQHSSIPDVLIASTYLWNRLNDQEKAWLQEAADRSVEYQKKLWAASVEESLEEVQKAGVTVYYPDKKPFQKKVEGLYEGYKSDANLYKLIKEIKLISEQKSIQDESKN